MRFSKTNIGQCTVLPGIAAVVFLGALTQFSATNSGLPITIVLILAAAFLCGRLGVWFPVIRRLGLDTILAIYVPSLLVYAGCIKPEVAAELKSALEKFDILSWFICVIIFGSIFSIDWRALAEISIKALAPIIAGSIAALIAGTAAGALGGADAAHTLLFLVVPVMAGGVTAGALPLASVYTHHHTSGGPGLDTMLAAIALGNLLSIILAALLQFKHDANFQPTERDVIARGEPSSAERLPALELRPLAIGFGAIAAMYAITSLLAASGIALPLSALVLASVLNFTGLLPHAVTRGIVAFYRFCVFWLTLPLLVTIGVAFISWERTVAGLTLTNVSILFAMVFALAAAGYWVSRKVGLDAKDGALIALTRAAMGGTGDLAILSTARRLDLMPIAQVSTRIGGLMTVALTSVLVTLVSF